MSKIKVSYTKTAKLTLEEIKEFILLHHTSKEVRKLQNKINEVKSTLEKGNVNYKYFKNQEVYKVVVHKYSSMYYKRVDEENIHIIFFRDNRMDNENNLFEEE